MPLKQQANSRQWLQIARERPVVRRVSISAVIVGALLITINHGDALLAGDLSFGRLLKIGLTILVTYVVSTVSSVAVLRELRTGAISCHLETPHRGESIP